MCVFIYMTTGNCEKSILCSLIYLRGRGVKGEKKGGLGLSIQIKNKKPKVIKQLSVSVCVFTEI